MTKPPPCFTDAVHLLQIVFILYFLTRAWQVFSLYFFRHQFLCANIWFYVCQAELPSTNLSYHMSFIKKYIWTTLQWVHIPLIAGSRSGLPCLSFVYQQNLGGYLSPPCCSLPSPDCTPEPLVCPCILIISQIVWWQCNFCNFIEIYTYMCTCRSTLNICLALPNI